MADRPTRCALLFFLLACGGGHQAFPAGLTPFASDHVDFPAAAASDAHPEMLVAVSGTMPDYAWVQAKAYVHAAITDTWAAARTPIVCVDRRHVGVWTVMDDVEQGYDYSFLLANRIDNVVTFEEDVTWRESHVSGSPASPTMVVAIYQKTGGGDFIIRDTASIVMQVVDAHTTSLTLSGQLNALGSGAADLETYFRDYHASIVAEVHGQPLPTY